MTYHNQLDGFFTECGFAPKGFSLICIWMLFSYFAWLGHSFSFEASLLALAFSVDVLARFWSKRIYVHIGSPFSRELKFKQLPSPSEFIPYPHKRLKTPHKMLTAEELAAFRERVEKYPDALKDVDVNNITHAVALNVELVIHQYYKRKLAERHAEQSLMEEITKLNNLLEESSKDG